MRDYVMALGMLSGLPCKMNNLFKPNDMDDFVKTVTIPLAEYNDMQCEIQRLKLTDRNREIEELRKNLNDQIDKAYKLECKNNILKYDLEQENRRNKILVDGLETKIQQKESVCKAFKIHNRNLNICIYSLIVCLGIMGIICFIQM